MYNHSVDLNNHIVRFSSIESSLLNFLSTKIENSADRTIIAESLVSKFNLSNPNTASQIELADLYFKSDDGSILDLKSQRLKLSSMYLIKNLVFQILYFTISSLIILLPKKPFNSQNICVFFGLEKSILESKLSIQKILSTLSDSKISLINDGSFAIFENRKKIGIFSNNLNFEIVPDVSVSLVRRILPIKKRLFLLYKIFKNLKQCLPVYRSLFLLSSNRNLFSRICWETILANPTYTFHFTVTQSNLEKLPTPFFIQKRNRNMIWYSNNSIPIFRKGTKPSKQNKRFTSDFIDSHFVWSESHKQVLRIEYPSSEIKVVGPIDLQRRNSDDSCITKVLDQVIYFDVTPFIRLQGDTFYTEDICIRALEDIATVSKELKFELLLKPKRKYIRRKMKGFKHSPIYLNFLDQLEKNGDVVLIPYSQSPHNLILTSKFVLGLPYTSPVLLAHSLGVESFYYVPEEIENWDFPHVRDGIRILQGKVELKNTLLSLSK